VIAHISPAAPAPMMMVSYAVMKEEYRFTGLIRTQLPG
jgi:hypothetical protein